MECGSLSDSQNNICLGSKGGHKNESNTIDRYKQNDLIEVEYERETQKVTVKNMTRKTQSVSYIKVKNSFPLHFAVSLCSQDN